MTYHYNRSLGKVSLLHLDGWKAYYQGNHSTAETLLEEALQLQYQHYTPNNLLTAETLILSTVVAYCQGKQEEAMNYLQRVMKVLRNPVYTASIGWEDILCCRVSLRESPK